MATFATRIKEQRLKHRLTQKGLAEKLGRSAQTVSLWERGDRRPDWSAQIDLKEFFEVSIDYLSGASDDDTPVKTQTSDDLYRQEIMYDDDELYRMAVQMCQLSTEMRAMVNAVIKQAHRLDKEKDRLCPEQYHEVTIRSSYLLDRDTKNRADHSE